MSLGLVLLTLAFVIAGGYVLFMKLRDTVTQWARQHEYTVDLPDAIPKVHIIEIVRCGRCMAWAYTLHFFEVWGIMSFDQVEEWYERPPAHKCRDGRA